MAIYFNFIYYFIIQTVKYFTAEKFEIARFKDSVIKYQKFSFASQYSVGILNFCQQAVIASTLAGTMLVAGRAVVRGDMNIGDFIAVNAYVVGMFQPLSFLGSVYGWVIQALVDIKNLSQLLTEPIEVNDVEDAEALPFMERAAGKGGDKAGAGAGARSCKQCHKSWGGGSGSLAWKFCPHCGADSWAASVAPADGLVGERGAGISVEFRNLSFNYPGQPVERGLKGVSIMVPPGTTTAIVGPSGAGKSTIARMLFRFYDPRTGSIA
jgi:ABC-type transport system involved in Fe-S cluster assembly fused permease/ATPase subunit